MDKSNAELQKSYEENGAEILRTLRSLQNPHLESWEIATTIERLELLGSFHDYLMVCMHENYLIN